MFFFIGSLGSGVADEPYSFLACRIVQGLGVGLIQVPTLAMVRDECPGAMA